MVIREGRGLSLRAGRGTHPGQTQGGGTSEDRCSYTWNSFHEVLRTPLACAQTSDARRDFLAVSCEFERSLADLHVSLCEDALAHV
jgi:hypothetical protein